MSHVGRRSDSFRSSKSPSEEALEEDSALDDAEYREDDITEYYDKEEEKEIPNEEVVTVENCNEIVDPNNVTIK